MRKIRKANMGGEASAMNPLQQLQVENNKLKDEAEKYKIVIDDLEAKLRSSQNDLNTLHDEASTLKDHIQSQPNGSNQNLINRIKELEDKNNTLLLAQKQKDLDYVKDIKSLNAKIDALQKKNIKLEETIKTHRNSNGSSTGKAMTPESILHSVENFDITSNAKKIYKAIFDTSKEADKIGKWVQISSRFLKVNYKVHPSHFHNSREELVEADLIEHKQSLEKGTKRSITEYRLKV